ncbi:MAG: hypothetical protein HOW73_04420 [Polyangiaceae bacterium]|nr:hypothetical protein [Polyangiaceae bacterium]
MLGAPACGRGGDIMLAGKSQLARIALQRPCASIVLWGTPLLRRYRTLVREIEVLSKRPVVIQHRHHAFDTVGVDRAFECAEAVEIAAQLGKRTLAQQWFISHGEVGLVPPCVLASQIGVDPFDYQRRFFEGLGHTAVERDLQTAKRLGFDGPIVAVIDGRAFKGNVTAEELLDALPRFPNARSAADGVTAARRAG